MGSCEKMKVALQNIVFEKAGTIVKSHGHQSLTLVANEHWVTRERVREDCETCQPELRVYYHFIIRSTNSDSGGGSTLAFWNMQIGSFVYFVHIGSRIKLTLMPEFNEGIITIDFLNPDNAELFWYYALKNRRRRRVIQLRILFE